MSTILTQLGTGSTCLCRPLYQVPASSTAETQSVPTTSGTPSLPPNPTIPITSTAAPGRIQKHTRRPSNFQHPSNNVIKALDSELMQAEYKNDFLKSTKTPALDRSTAYTPVSVHMPSYDSTQTISIKTEKKAGGCCSEKSAKMEPVTPASEPQQRSCCGVSVTKQEEEPVLSMPDNRLNSAWNETFYNSQNTSWNTQLPNIDFASQGNIYTNINMKPSYYTNQHESNQSAMPRTFHHMDTQHQANISGPSMDQFYLNTASYPFDMSLPFVEDSNHDCSCGDSCQCLGCASHPYNETTRQHVQEMGYMMTVKEDEEKSGTSSPFSGLNSPPAMKTRNPSIQNHSSTPTNIQPSFTDDNTFGSTFENNINSPAYASSQFMQPSEYYTIEYPVGLNLCSDITGTCQCGNDCSCVGCITHSGHDGIVLESMPAESQPTPDQASPPQQFHDYYSQNPGMPRSMDQYSPSALSPPLVETPLV